MSKESSKRSSAKTSFSKPDVVMLSVILIIATAVVCVTLYESPPTFTILSLMLGVAVALFTIIRSVQSYNDKMEAKMAKALDIEKIKTLEKEREELVKKQEDVNWVQVKNATEDFPRLLRILLKERYPQEDPPNFEPDFILAVNAKGAIIAEMIRDTYNRICNTWKDVPIYVGTMIFRSERSRVGFTGKDFQTGKRTETWYVRTNDPTLKFFETMRWYVSIPAHILAFDEATADNLKVLIVHDYSLSGSVIEKTINCLERIGFKKGNIINYCLVVDKRRVGKTVDLFSLEREIPHFHFPWGEVK